MSLKPKRIFYFDPDEIAKGLREMSVDTITTKNHQIKSYWYRSHTEADLFIWVDNKSSIIKQQFNVYGQVVEWNIIDGIKTGYITEGETLDGRVLNSQVKYDSNVQVHAVNQALDICQRVEKDVFFDKDQLVKNFLEAPHFGSLSPKEVIQRYGVSRVSGLEKLKRRFFKFLSRFL